VSKPHYTILLRAFIDGRSGGLDRIELRRLGLIEVSGPGPKGPRYRLTARGKERARRLGYLKQVATK
jgi:hypothetical protein